MSATAQQGRGWLLVSQESSVSIPLTSSHTILAGCTHTQPDFQKGHIIVASEESKDNSHRKGRDPLISLPGDEFAV